MSIADKIAAGYTSGRNTAVKPAVPNNPAPSYVQPTPPASQPYVGTGTYNDQGLSQQDMAAILGLKQQYETSKAQGAPQSHLDDLHMQAEAIRAQYKYSGGGDGSEYYGLNNELPQKSPIVSATPQNGYVDNLYNAQREAALAALKSAYEQNQIDLNATAGKIPGMYQAARNQTAATAEQERAMFNERAAASGLNSGAGGQADLAMRNQNVNNMSNISAQESNAMKDLETTRLKLSTAYQNDIAQAIAQGDLERAQALYQEAVRVDNSLVQQSMAQADENYRYWSSQNQFNQQQYQMQLQRAETLAAYGDFSGFVEMGYSPEQTYQMQRIWAAKNPLLAQSIGMGSFSAGSGGGYGGGTPKSPDAPPKKDGTDGADNLHTLNMKLSQIEANGVGVAANAQNAIKQYLQQGLISEATAKKMLANYGM